MVTGNKIPKINFKENIKKALKEMNQKKLGIVVILKNKFIKGLVTDGDLRRELKDFSSNQNLKKFIGKTPLSVNENMPVSKALSIMNEKNHKLVSCFR